MTDFLIDAEERIYEMHGTEFEFQARRVERDIKGKERVQQPPKKRLKTTPSIPPLPYEIVEIIMDQLLQNYARALDFKNVLQIATSFTKSYTEHFCLELFGVTHLGEVHYPKSLEELDVPEDSLTVKRIGQTIKLLSVIYETYILRGMTPYVKDYKLQIQFQSIHFTDPWNCLPIYTESYQDLLRDFRLNIVNMTDRLDMDIYKEWYTFQCGPCLGDTVWLEGDRQRSVLIAYDFLSPVLVLDLKLYSGNHVLDNRRRKVKKTISKGWSAFNKLYRLFFGESGAVFFVMIPDTGIFNDMLDELRYNYIHKLED